MLPVRFAIRPTRLINFAPSSCKTQDAPMKTRWPIPVIAFPREKNHQHNHRVIAATANFRRGQAKSSKGVQDATRRGTMMPNVSGNIFQCTRRNVENGQTKQLLQEI